MVAAWAAASLFTSSDAVDKFYDMIKEGSVYYMSSGKLKMANRTYTSIPHQYEITFDKNANIQIAPDDKGIEKIAFSFVDIAGIASRDPGVIVDVIGIVSEVGSLTNLTSRAGTWALCHHAVCVCVCCTSLTHTPPRQGAEEA